MGPVKHSEKILLGVFGWLLLLWAGVPELVMADNVASLLQQNAYVIILALGMLMIIIAGHIDLSVGSVVAFLGGIMGIAMIHWGLNWVVACLIGIVVGVLVGAWQGFWVAYVGIPGFIVTCSPACCSSAAWRS